MKEKTLGFYTLIAFIVFGVLLVFASIFDYEINVLLADLNVGEYISQNPFGRTLDVVGELPIYFFLIYSCSVIFWNAFYSKNAKVKYVLMVIMAGLIFFTSYYIPNRAFGTLEEIGGRVIESKPLDVALDVLFALAISSVSIFGVMATGKERIKKQLGLAIVIIFTAACSQLVTQGLKVVNKRVRFVALNVLGSDEYFTPWYKINGYPEEFKAITAIIGNSDCLKSFPSGHTSAAGIVYCLIALPYVFEGLNTKKWKAIFVVVAVVYTGAVALSRIVMGAHYFSDVLFGGSLTFFFTLLAIWLLYVKKIIPSLQKHICNCEGEE